LKNQEWETGKAQRLKWPFVNRERGSRDVDLEALHAPARLAETHEKRFFDGLEATNVAERTQICLR
jgi:uncharacterized linocin/CFP29 family protein